MGKTITANPRPISNVYQVIDPEGLHTLCEDCRGLITSESEQVLQASMSRYEEKLGRLRTPVIVAVGPQSSRSKLVMSANINVDLVENRGMQRMSACLTYARSKFFPRLDNWYWVEPLVPTYPLYELGQRQPQYINGRLPSIVLELFGSQLPDDPTLWRVATLVHRIWTQHIDWICAPHERGDYPRWLVKQRIKHPQSTE